ncbi:MAG TPA: hypothetical protein VFI65_29345, partial [Streptosporangiaceae bacterium]|nr:hypothetical protein [Streptosporangiaceae bacterium]
VVDTDDGGEASVQAIMVGALTAGDEELGEPTRSDSPAARAHQLAQAIQQAEHEADLAAGGFGAAHPLQPPPTTQANLAAPVPAPIPEPAPGAQAAAGIAGVAGDLEEEDDEDGPRRRSFRRRWPVVTCVLMLLVSVVGVAGYFGWRLTQSQYYVGTDRGNVVVFRGVSQSVAGMSLSKVVQRTNIPLSALPSSEAGSIRSTIGPEASLKEALRIISQFRQDYKCAVVQASIIKWVANRPKPAPAPKHHSKTKSGKSRTRAKHPAPKPTTTPHHSPSPTPTPVKPANTSKSTGTTTHSPASHSNQSGSTNHNGPTRTSTSKTTHHRTGKTTSHQRRKTSKPRSVTKVKYPPEPVLPAFCPAFTGASG